MLRGKIDSFDRPNISNDNDTLQSVVQEKVTLIKYH